MLHCCCFLDYKFCFPIQYAVFHDEKCPYEYLRTKQLKISKHCFCKIVLFCILRFQFEKRHNLLDNAWSVVYTLIPSFNPSLRKNCSLKFAFCTRGMQYFSLPVDFQSRHCFLNTINKINHLFSAINLIILLTWPDSSCCCVL